MLGTFSLIPSPFEEKYSHSKLMFKIIDHLSDFVQYNCI